MGNYISRKQKMPTIFKKIKAKAKSSRGGAAPDFIIKQFEDDAMNEWFENIQEMNDEDKQQILDDMNEVADGFGDGFTADAESYGMSKADLGADELKVFATKLITSYFEIEGVDTVTDE